MKSLSARARLVTARPHNFVIGDVVDLLNSMADELDRRREEVLRIVADAFGCSEPWKYSRAKADELENAPTPAAPKEDTQT